MKLNLLPKAVAKEASLKKSIFMAVIIFAAAVGASFMMITNSRNLRDEAFKKRDEAKPQADQAIAIAKAADTEMLRATGVNTNVALYEAMQKHSDVYPALYDELRGYVPSFLRVTSMQAVPSGTGCTVTITGVLKSFQEYADIMIAMLRVPGIQGVNRSGFVNLTPQVLPISQANTSSVPRAPGEVAVPLDLLKKYDYIVQNGPLPDENAAAKGLVFTGVGGFGSDEVGPRGAMPGYSAVTITLVLERNLQAPQVRTTVGAASAAATGGGAPAPTPASSQPASKGKKAASGGQGDGE